MLVEHRERDNISFNSVTSACAVDKQLVKELAVFHSMGGKCVEKTHRSNSVLLNALRRRPAAASFFATGRDGSCGGVGVVAIRTCVSSWNQCDTKISQFEF